MQTQAELAHMISEFPDTEPSKYDEDELYISKRRGWSPMKVFKSHRNDSKDSRPHWKPVSLQAPILGTFVLFSIVIIIVLEILSHISARNGNANGGGLVFATDVHHLSTMVKFCYLYLPTILAVFYSILWSWVDLDTKRLEPWFQLSNPKGALAKDSLRLQYPFDFLPFVPITALRRKHWAVFLAGTIMLMVFGIITPLQSAIFNSGSVLRAQPMLMGTTANLIPIQSQEAALNYNFLHTAYGVSWLGQNLPIFTTANYAVSPFAPVNASQTTLPMETWTTMATAFSTNLTCSPAKITLGELDYTFDNGNGCIVPNISLFESRPDEHLIMYTGYYDNPHLDYALQNRNCSLEHANNFLALYAPGSSYIVGSNGLYSNLTALFCYPTYHSTNLSVTVNATSHAIINHSTSAATFSTDIPKNIFNTTTFEYILGVGITPTSIRSNFPETARVELFSELENYHVTWPVTNMVGFALALNTLRLEDLAEPAALHAAFQNAHQLLFTTAFSTLTGPVVSGNTSDNRDGVRRGSFGAIIMVRLISLIVEGAFALIAVLTVGLWYVSYCRRSNMRSNPASIGSVMSILTSENGDQIDIDDTSSVAHQGLNEKLSRKRFRLTVHSNHNPLLEQFDTPENISYEDTASSKPNLSELGLDSAVRPREFRLWFGGLFIVVLAISVTVLGVLRTWSLKHNGFSLPTDNPVVLSIIENYVPTAFATLIEPTWIVLNRFLCVLQPFEELRKGNAKASTTLDVKYTSLPPQLIFLRAIRARHFILATVCIVAISTNILAVTLAALLTEVPTYNSFSFASSYSLQPMFNGSTVLDSDFHYEVPQSNHFYVANSQFSGTPLPAWIDNKFFYQPFDLKVPPLYANGSRGYLALKEIHGTTTGFGASVNCALLSNDSRSGEFNLQLQVNQNSSEIPFSHRLSNGEDITCITSGGAVDSGTVASNGLHGLSKDVAMEVLQPARPRPGFDDGGLCSSMVVAGWARSHPFSSGLSSEEQSFKQNVTSTFLTCSPALRAAKFDVTVDESGHIMSSEKVDDFVADTNSFFQGNHTSLLLIQQSNKMIAPSTIDQFFWHNDSFASDWINSLLGSTLHSTSLVDPSAPVPDESFIAPILEDLLEQLFAIIIGINPHLFIEAQPPIATTAEAVVIETRIFVSPLMFTISIIILGIQLLVAILIYAKRPRRFLPRMPTSIGSIIPFVSSSRALEDFAPSKEADVDEAEIRYGYGRFIGTDGKPHVGIERQRDLLPPKIWRSDV